MYYEDLIPYQHLSLNPCEELVFPYNSSRYDVLNIGWLDQAKPFTKGQISPETLSIILMLCFKPVNITRGCHFCNLCSYEEPPMVEWHGSRARLGAAEIWVPGKGQIVYSAPDLIYHYIRDHSYCPPKEFISAVNDFGVELASAESQS